MNSKAEQCEHFLLGTVRSSWVLCMTTVKLVRIKMRLLMSNPNKTESGGLEGKFLMHTLPGIRNLCKRSHQTSAYRKPDPCTKVTSTRISAQGLPIKPWTGTTLVTNPCSPAQLFQNNLYNPPHFTFVNPSSFRTPDLPITNPSQRHTYICKFPACS